MSGRITIDNLSDSLKEMIANSGMTEEQIIELLENEEVIDSLKTDSKSIVGAINELFQSANNGKELIASAIGEPLNSEDTFSAMSNDINGLLRTFKTNMMNNGVMVESGDRFKSLIDKIATLSDSGGKGMQFAQGSVKATSTLESFSISTASWFDAFRLEVNDLTFKPSIIILTYNENGKEMPLGFASTLVDTIQFWFYNREDRHFYQHSLGEYYYNTITPNLTDNGFLLYATIGSQQYNYYAIGVGEEDTTLRDSLASILQEEGVIVTEEDDMASLISKTDNEFTKDNNTISGLESDINNGKSIIANAIGTPLTSTDTFTEMGSDINGLLSTFKTNMMKNGVTVNSGDKFKALIDKIATLADNEGGLQYVTGNATANGDVSYDFLSSDGTENGAIYIDLSNLGFTPMFVIVTYNNSPTSMSVYIDKSFGFYFSNYMNVKGKSFTIRSYSDGSSGPMWHSDNNNLKIAATATGVHTYHAIGVGKEDTTLRDSLASILTEEGVGVTEEDDMASLISKVDEEFDRKNTEMENSGGLDIISATTLPATGKENQICVITDNPVNNFIMTGDSAEYDNNKVVIYNSTGNSNYNAVKNNITYSYNISRVQYQSNDLSSYYWGNNQWNQLTFGSTVLFKNGEFLSTDLTGGFGTGEGVSISGSEFAFVGGRDVSLISTTTKQINFSNFKTLKVTMYTNNSNTFIVGSFMNTYSGKQSSTFNTTGKTYNIYRLTPLTTETEMSIDISGWTTGYLGFFRAAQSVAPSIYITKITLE